MSGVGGGDTDGVPVSGAEARDNEGASATSDGKREPLLSRKLPRLSKILDFDSTRVKTKESVTQIKDAAKSKLYKEYRDVLESIAPELKGMGRSVGKQMLKTLEIPMNDTGEQKWRESLGYIGIYPELTQSVVKPVLQPFCDGLWEPFDGFLGKFKNETYMMIATGAATGLVTGFLIGRQSKKD